MSEIKWIPLGGMDLSAANLAAAEKLRKFGFAVICGEFGSEKLTKAGMCVYDVLQEKDNPNILIVTSDRELYGWYRILMTGIGADFKIITGAPNALTFFSKDCPNLYLMSREALMGQNALRLKAGANYVWDLIIVDEEQNTDVPDYSAYQKNIAWSAEKLLLIAPFPARNEEDKNALASLVKNVLDDKNLAETADDISFDAGACSLDADSPVMRYYDKKVYTGELKRNIEFCEYGFEDSVLKSLRRRIEIRTGLPVYRFGGNVFEDYDVEQHRKLYEKNSYTRSDVEDLRAFDKKLDCFLNLIDKVMEDDGSRAIVYCCEKNTIEYLRKVLTCVYKNSGKIIRTAKGDLFRTEDVIRKLRVDDSTEYPKVILGVDALGAVGEGLDRINYIINYELPDSAVLLERRFTRHGSCLEADRKFIIFRDTNNAFDSVMLDKVLYGSIATGFCGELPARNVLLDIDTKADSLNAVIADLKYIASYASEVDNCGDLIKKVKCDYALLGADAVSNSKQLVEFANKQLDSICTVFGVTRDSSPEEIAAAINALSGLCTTDAQGKLVKLSNTDAIAQSFEGDGYLKQSFASEAVSGLDTAKKLIDEWHSGENFHLKVKQELSALADCIQYPVLFGIWRFRVREQGSQRSFRDYIRIYNDGI